MAIKKLNKNNLTPVKISLSSADGLYFLKMKDLSFECLYIIRFEDKDFKGLGLIGEVESYIYIGSKLIFNKIKTEGPTWAAKHTRVVEVTSQMEVLYTPKTGNVKVPKQRKEAIPSGPQNDKRVENKSNVHSLKKYENKQKAITRSNEVKKVLIIDDSKTIQKLLKKIIEPSKKLKVIGVADRPSVARQLIEREKPDLITLDIHMPEMNGVEFLKSYLCELNINIVMISSVSMNEGPLVMDALSNGASTYIQKPSVGEIDKIGPSILEELEEVSNNVYMKTAMTKTKTNHVVQSNFRFSQLDGLVAIGSSTGGTQALQTLFTSLPDEIPAIAIVQHIPAVFSKALADRLNLLCKFTVKEAENNEEVKKNTIYIAPGGQQFKIIKKAGKKIIEINDDDPVNRFKPSVDYLFHSLAKIGCQTGVILTGMGRDGAKGLLELKESGALTIAQDEETSVVFGMPKEAIALGAADKVCPLGKMGEEIILSYNRATKPKAA